jgi:uncharacterized protein
MTDAAVCGEPVVSGMLGWVDRALAEITVADELRLFLRSRHRQGPIRVACDGVSTLGHVVQSLGVPLTEVGGLTVNGVQAQPSYRLTGGDLVQVEGVRRPQPLPATRFVLDVHLGTLARRLRLLGIDAAYANDADDDTLIELANTQRRVLLTQDRGLLYRRALRAGAFVRGARPNDQLFDVLERFVPPLSPWTRCPVCNGLLREATRPSVDSQLKPGTRRTYRSFSRCVDCGQVYWRGAHSDRLQAIIDEAVSAVTAAGGGRVAPSASPTPPIPPVNAKTV